MTPGSDGLITGILMAFELTFTQVFINLIFIYLLQFDNYVLLDHTI